MSISDFTQIHTVNVVWSKVTKKMYKEYKQTFIGLKDKLDAGDVIGYFGIAPVAFCVWCYSSILDMVKQAVPCWCEEE